MEKKLPAAHTKKLAERQAEQREFFRFQDQVLQRVSDAANGKQHASPGGERLNTGPPAED
jgi:hypothetical protein